MLRKTDTRPGNDVCGIYLQLFCIIYRAIPWRQALGWHDRFRKNIPTCLPVRSTRRLPPVELYCVDGGVFQHSVPEPVFVPRASRFLFAAVAIAAALSPLAAVARQPGDSTMVMEEPGMSSEGCGCRPGQWQQPPWHGNVHADHCGQTACCPGSSVYQAYPFRMLHAPRPACVRPPSYFPRLHTLYREGYMPTPIPPAQPRCHQCGAPIEGGF